MLKSLLISNKSKSILLIQLQVDIGFSKLEFSEMPTLLRENAAMFPLGLKGRELMVSQSDCHLKCSGHCQNRKAEGSRDNSLHNIEIN
jgi:hypothetical protein